MNRMVKEKKSFEWVMKEAAGEIADNNCIRNRKRKYEDDTDDEQVITSLTIPVD